MDVISAIKRALVVDDNEDAAMLIAELLRFRGHSVQVATGGPEGYAAAQASSPDVVVLDIGMPIMDGYQVARAIRCDPVKSGARLVALTAWGDADSRERARRSGFDFHLVKPADCGALFPAVED